MIMKTFKQIIILISLSLIFAACSEESADVDNSGEAGIGGSLARFTVANDHLYTVDEQQLRVFDITNSEKPEFVKEKYVGFGVETIFPKGNTLFLGTETGMYIYNIEQASSPVQLSFFEHIQACDPVVADEDQAYVTLSSSNQRCFRNVNELQIVDISNLNNPQLEASYEMFSPLGLSVNNDTLYVCDDGIKVFDVSEPNNIEELFHFAQIKSRDVIYHDNKLLVIGEDGFHQFRIENDELVKISELLIGQ